MNYLENLDTPQEIQKYNNPINQYNKVRTKQGQTKIKTVHYKVILPYNLTRLI